MRAGLSTIRQTLTPEASSVLNDSIAEAARRGHGQTTPLHVAATLLASPAGQLRQACVSSHPDSSSQPHPLKCRALELCFSVALDRFSSTGRAGADPAISNALMAALKRAQAHQRRGCPEQQQQPLLAVKVELEQLIVSILDDPGVSRVMREASFSSTAVKAAIEQSMQSSGIASSAAPPIGMNLYMNPRLQQQHQAGQQKREEVRRVVDILLRWKKRNPVLVGESETEGVVREVLEMIQKREVSDNRLRDVGVVHLEKEFGPDRSRIHGKMAELADLVEARAGNGGGGLIIDLGDLKWLVEQPAGLGVLGGGSIPQLQKAVTETGLAVVMEMGNLLSRFSGNLWLIGRATCETYLRCQVYHPSMENDWGLQATPIAARGPLPGLFPRLGSAGILSNSIGSVAQQKGVPLTGTALPPKGILTDEDPAKGTSYGPACKENYQRDLVKIGSNDGDGCTTDCESKSHPSLPKWMQNAKLGRECIKSAAEQSLAKDQTPFQSHKTEELLKKWNENCRRLHPSFHSAVGFDRKVMASHSLQSLYNPKLLGRQPHQPKLQQTQNAPILQLNNNPTQNAPDQPISPSKSPVQTDLVLGFPKISCINDPSSWQLQSEKHANALDADSFKSISKGLTEKVGWQLEAATAVATAIIQRQANHENRQGLGLRGHRWLMFAGPDKVGKKKMASALSELVFGTLPITIRLGSSRPEDDEEADVSSRGKTALDRVAEAVRRNPFSVVVLDNVDHADMLVQAGIKRAIDKGRLTDSYGREIGLGSVIFVLTAEWVPENLNNLPDSQPNDEGKLAAAARRKWRLQISVRKQKSKRSAEWLAFGDDEERPKKARKDALPFDLNLAADAASADDLTESSWNSSDVTVEHSSQRGPVDKQSWQPLPPSSSPMKNILIGTVNDAIVFNPVNFGPLRSKVASTIATKFAAAVGDGRPIHVDSVVVERILAGTWFGQTGFEEWADRVLVPGFRRLKDGSLLEDCMDVRLSCVTEDSCSRSGELLPGEITVAVD
ncbi:hypothetical protein ACLOJK_030590 [Asimina triloba]